VSLGPQVPNMEFRDLDDLSMALEGPYFLQCSPHITNNDIHHTGLVLKWQCVSLHEVMRPGIMVCITLIFESLEHVLLNPSSFHDVCLEIILFALFKPRKVTQFPNKLISL
jgi:hypothetical protein